MQSVTSTEFRNNASAILDAVERGETVRISRHGRVIAEIVPAIGDGRQPSWKRRGLRLGIRGADLARTILMERDPDR